MNGIDIEKVEFFRAISSLARNFSSEKKGDFLTVRWVFEEGVGD